MSGFGLSVCNTYLEANKRINIGRVQLSLDLVCQFVIYTLKPTTRKACTSLVDQSLDHLKDMYLLSSRQCMGCNLWGFVVIINALSFFEQYGLLQQRLKLRFGC
jgi:hypothetical protein